MKAMYSFIYTFFNFIFASNITRFHLDQVNKLANPNAPLGHGLCFLNLVFDGFTNATQDSISASLLVVGGLSIFALAKVPTTNAWDMMLGMNLWGTVYNAIFMFRWPQASGYQAYITISRNSLGYFIRLFMWRNWSKLYITISRFGSLTNTTITTTRKFVSIVVSSLLSGNPCLESSGGVCYGV
ncbi:UDP-galactose/UDP-glucose transporter 3 [Artemisia annua]|uniref:UDP-galactose/UDP-glucose transporter 3 n=1 Tax=Artemisia annua TaxID=35608 RepID=A0A2U1NKX9_ARTAN|nr:UDP-galactose/UDP-glucose transporter 3 [Artemisia annua]